MNQLETVLFDILHYFLVNIIIFGFVGNILCFKIYSTVALRKHSISLFFRTIAIIDTFMLLSGFMFFLEQRYDFKFITLNVLFCKCKDFLFDSAGPVSPWLMCVVSIDRYISIAFPKRFLVLFKFKFQLCVIFFIFVFNYALYSPVIWFNVLVQGFILFFENFINIK